MKHHEYPKWLYSETKAPKLVQNEEEHGELEGEWKESPADFKPEAKKKSEKLTQEDLVAMTVADLKAYVISKGETEETIKGMKKDELIVLASGL